VTYDRNKAAAAIAGSYLRDHVLDLEMLSRASGAPPGEAEQLVDAFVAIGREMFERAGVRACRKCLCTEDWPCDGGCVWTAQDECSSCSDNRIVTPDSRLVVP
jgi:hypothetical protein